MSENKQFQQLRNIQTNPAKYIDFDISSILRDAVGSQLWKNKQGLWTAISGACNGLAKQTYTKIDNLIQNIVDIDTCNVHALKSIAASVNASHLTDYIIEDYPEQLQKLINLFSVHKNIILNSNAFISQYALYTAIGSIDNRNKDIYNDSNYSKILFYEILQHLDELKYLLETENGINFNYSIWNYLNIKNRNIAYTSIISTMQGTDEKTYTAPSLNKIFNELYYLKTEYQKKYILQKNKIQNQYDKTTKYTLFYKENFSGKYLGQTVSKELTKDFIIEKCTTVHKYKDFNFISNKQYQNQIIFGWNPYETDVINNSQNFTLYNNFKINSDTLLINPFIILIAIFKNLLFNNKGKRLALSYIDEKTNETIDLSFIILKCVQAIQYDYQSYYNQMMVYHFYGLFYDMIINEYLKKQWNIIIEDSKLVQKYIGTYSEYTKEEFLNKIPKSVKNNALVEFFENGPTYYNQYHLDFITYLNIINNNITEIGLKEFSYVISNYNNNFDIAQIKNYIYNSQKRRLLGFETNIKYINNITQIEQQDNFIYFNVDKSIIFYIANKFAQYCEKIRLTRQSIKQLIQLYAKIGTTEIIENIIKQYFYKEYNKNTQVDLKTFSIQLVQHFDITNYMNIQAELPKKIIGYDIGQPITSLVQLSGKTPSSYVTEFMLQKDVLSSSANIKYILQQDSIITNGQINNNSNTNFIEYSSNTNIIEFDNIISTPRPIQKYCPEIAAVSSITQVYNGIQKTIYYFCTYYNTNGYSNQLSGKWTTYYKLPQVSGITTITMPTQQHLQPITYTTYEILNKNLTLSSIYDVNSSEYHQLVSNINPTNTDNIKLSAVIAIDDAIIIPSGTLVSKFRTDEIDYTYNAVVTSGFEKKPIYADQQITDTVNHRYWDTNDSVNDNINSTFEKQILFWQKYFPQLKIANTEESKKNIYKNQIYPFLCKVLQMHYTSGFSGQLSGMQKEYIGNQTGDKRISNLTNTVFPSIASVPNIANLIEKAEISKQNNLYINLYLNTFYTNLAEYSQNVLKGIIDSTTRSSQSLMGYPASSWYYCYTTFTGYNSVYGQCDNINQGVCQPNKHIQVDGPWIYDILQYFVKTYYNSQLDLSGAKKAQDIELIFGTLAGPLSLYNQIYLAKKKQLYAIKPIYYLSYQKSYEFVKTHCKFIRSQQQRQLEAMRIFLYQKNIIEASNYIIYNYKEDMYNNSISLFKRNGYTKFEDCGQLWIRTANSSLSFPLTFCRQIPEEQSYNYDVQDVLICKEHNRYANIIKQITNNALDFGIFDNKIWILGKTNYIKQDQLYIKQNKPYLTLCVFQYQNDSNNYVINLSSLKFINFQYNVSYLARLNNFVCAYNNYKENLIEFVLYDHAKLNLQLTQKYKQLYKSQNQYESEDKKQHIQDVINSNLHLDNLDITLTKISYSINDYSLSTTEFNIPNTKYPIIGLFNNEQLINNKKYYQNNLNTIDYEDGIKEATKLIYHKLYKEDIIEEDIIKYIAETVLNYGLRHESEKNPLSGYLVSGIADKVSSIFKLDTEEYQIYKNSSTIELSTAISSIYTRTNVQVNNGVYSTYNIILEQLASNYENKSDYFDYFTNKFNLDRSLFDYSYEYKTIQDFVGYKLTIYKNDLFDLKDSQYKVNRLNALVKLYQSVISYNHEYNSIDIIFDKLTETDNNDLHLNCNKNKRNIIVFCKEISDTNLNFTNKIFIKNIQSDYFKLDGLNYVFKFEPYMNCGCNTHHLDLNSGTERSFNNNLTIEQKTYIKNLVNKYLPTYKNIQINEAVIKNDIIADNYTMYKEFTDKANEAHVYLKLIFDQYNVGKYYYVMYYSEYDTVTNTNNIKYQLLGEKIHVHKPDCNTNAIEQNNQHIWRANLNNNNLYIGYESINTDIQNPAEFYKELYFNQIDELYIDTITFEATYVRKKIEQNVYANVIQDIEIKYGYDTIQLPFTFRQLSTLMLPEERYSFVDGMVTYDFKQQDIQFVLNYGTQINNIHKSYPKCEVTENKIKCTTILTKLGGIKDFKQDISTDKYSLQFMINYILYSSYKKKTNSITDTVIKSVFDQLLPSTSEYSINSFLFNIQQVKTLFGNQYFDYDLEGGFNDLLQIITKANLIKNHKKLVIHNKTVEDYLKSLPQWYKNADVLKNYEDLNNQTNKKSYNIGQSAAENYLLSLVAQKTEAYDILDEGFKFNFYENEQYKQGNRNQNIYLAYLYAMPAFGQCFNQNLKINVNFGQLSYEIKNFITGLESFDLDIACFIDDKDIQGQQYLKKVGWNCGYLKTDYIKWISNDNRFGGPEILQCDLNRYNNYLYNKFISVNQFTLPKCKHQLYNSIAKEINIHIQVCWYNQSMLMSLNPYIDIYWKGLHKQIKVDRTKMSRNRHCCQNSWGYDISIDLRNMMLNYRNNNRLYPVLTTQLAKKFYHTVMYNNENLITRNSAGDITSNKNLIFIDQRTPDANLQSNTKIIEHSLYDLLKVYNTYDITLLTVLKQTHKILTNAAKEEIITQYYKNILELTNKLCAKFIADLCINFNKTEAEQITITQKTEYNNKDILKAIGYIGDILASYYKNGTTYNTIDSKISLYDIIQLAIVRNNAKIADDKNYIYNLSTVFRRVITTDITTDTYNNLLQYMYEYFKTIFSFENIYIKYCQYVTDNFIIQQYNSNYPNAFYYYFTNIDIEKQLNKIKSNFVFPNLSMDLPPDTVLVDGKPVHSCSSHVAYDSEGALHSIQTDHPVLSDNYTLINLSETSGFILFLQKLDDKLKRSIIITDLKKLVKTKDKFEMTVENYYTISQNLIKYLNQVIVIDTPTGLNPIFTNDINVKYNYMPDAQAFIIPYFRNFVHSRYIDLTKFPDNWFQNINELYKDTGYYFDNNKEYENTIYNVMTNNYKVTYTNYIQPFILQSSLDNYNLAFKNEFKIQSQILYGVSNITKEASISTALSSVETNANYTNISIFIKDANERDFQVLTFDVVIKGVQLGFIKTQNNTINAKFENIPQDIYIVDVKIAGTATNVIKEQYRIQYCVASDENRGDNFAITVLVYASEYVYPKCDYIKNIGYNFYMNDLQKNNITGICCKPSIYTGLTENTTNISMPTNEATPGTYLAAINNQSGKDIYTIQLPTKENIGILELYVQPYYKVKNEIYKLDKSKTVISNYYNLFKVQVPPLTESNYITSNQIPLVITLFEKDYAHYNISNMLSENENLNTENIIFETADIQYPVLSFYAPQSSTKPMYQIKYPGRQFFIDQYNGYIHEAFSMNKTVNNILEVYFKDSKIYSDDKFETELQPQTKIIYIDIKTNKQYIWTGTKFQNSGISLLQLIKNRNTYNILLNDIINECNKIIDVNAQIAIINAYRTYIISRLDKPSLIEFIAKMSLNHYNGTVDNKTLYKTVKNKIKYISSNLPNEIDINSKRIDNISGILSSLSVALENKYTDKTIKDYINIKAVIESSSDKLELLSTHMAQSENQYQFARELDSLFVTIERLKNLIGIEKNECKDTFNLNSITLYEVIQKYIVNTNKNQNNKLINKILDSLIEYQYICKKCDYVYITSTYVDQKTLVCSKNHTDSMKIKKYPLLHNQISNRINYLTIIEYLYRYFVVRTEQLNITLDNIYRTYANYVNKPFIVIKYAERDQINRGDFILNCYGQKTQDFTFGISAYYKFNQTKYYVGNISGYYFFKQLEVHNVFKQNKNQFIFTPNMTDAQILDQLLGKNMLSTQINVIPQTNVLININNHTYKDIDFIDKDLSKCIIEIK